MRNVSSVFALVVVAAVVSPTSSSARGAPAASSSSPSSSSSAAKAKAETLVTEGKALLQKGDFAGAYGRFRAAVVADPAHPTALFNAALAARKGGLLDDARASYVELLAAHPDDLDVVWGLAEVERGLAHVDAARALYQKILVDEQRPDRQDLVARARAAIEQLAAPPSSSTKPATTTASVNDPARAESLFQEGQALAKAGQYADAGRAFDAAVAADATRVDGLLRGALQFRKAGDLDGARARYRRVLATPTSTKEQTLDAQFGLGETERLAGNAAAAVDLFRRYADGETRASEARYVEKARELAASLSSSLASSSVAQTPSVAVTDVASPAPPAVVQPSPPSSVLPPAASPPAPSPVPPPAPSPLPASTAVPSPASSPVPFPGDDLVVAALLGHAAAARAAGDVDAAEALTSRARALAVADGAPISSSPCRVDDELAAGERALSARDAASAVLAFRRASVCDGSRAAPLWGLSRAFDVAGARGQGRRHAALYVASAKRTPRPADVDDATLAAASLRAEAADDRADGPIGTGAGAGAGDDAGRPTTKPGRAP